MAKIKKSAKATTQRINQLSDEPTRVIYDEGEYQHIVGEIITEQSALLPLLEALDIYLKQTDPRMSQDDIAKAVNQHGDKIVKQLLQDNATERNFTEKNIAVCDSIIAYKIFNLAEIAPDTLQLIKAIRAIFLQYDGLLEYIPAYTEAYGYKFSDDDPKHIQFFKDFVDLAVKQYVYRLGDATGEIDKMEALISRKGLYTLLIQMDITLIEPNTQIQKFVAMIQAVQNNRIYRGRETMIIAINEAVAVANLIRLMWLLIQLNYNALMLENKDNSDLYEKLKELIEEFEKSRDPELIDKILDIIKQIEQEIKNKADEATKGSQMSADLITIGKLKDKSAIQRYIDSLDAFIAKINAITIDLARLNYALDYSGLQDALDKLGILQDLLDKLLGNTEFTKYFAKINEVLEAINRTAEAARAVNCLIKQAMCLVASALNFKNSVLEPAIKDIQNTIKQLGDDTETIIDNFARDALEPFDDAVRLVIYEQARAILKGRAYSVTTELGKDAEFTTKCNSVIDAVIDSAIGGATSAMEYLKNTSSKAISDIAGNFVPDERQATNCPPLTVKGTLSIPNLSLQTNLPSINDIKLSVEC